MEHGHHPTPDKIMQIGMGFWASKVVLAAVDLGLFTLLTQKKMGGPEIKKQLKLGTSDRHIYDFLDALVSLGFLQREGLLDSAVYANTPETETFLDEKKPSFIGGILKMANHRLYHFWGDLEEGLKTGQAQNESKGNLMEGGGFEMLYQDQQKLEEFMDAMRGIQTGNFMILADKFKFDDYQKMVDVGGADGWLSILVCQKHQKIHCTTMDLPPVGPLATKRIAGFGLQDRISFLGGDFMKDPIPAADVITMGNIIHGLDEETKQTLVNKVYQSLNKDGVLITIENVIDNDRRQNTFGLLMSLNMLIENGNAFDYTMDDFERWAKKAGFKKTERVALAGPTSAAIAFK